MRHKYIMYDPAEFDKIEIKTVENSMGDDEYCEGQKSNCPEILRLRAALAAVTEERDYVMTEGLFSADQIRVLKSERDAAIAERDRMREVIKSINAMLEISCETLKRPTYDSLEVGQRHIPLLQKEIIQRFTETCSFVRADLLRTMDEARAALEGVMEPPR